jgi:hypothetical protein
MYGLWDLIFIGSIALAGGLCTGFFLALLAIIMIMGGEK